jgi:hypothetical protein
MFSARFAGTLFALSIGSPALALAQSAPLPPPPVYADPGYPQPAPTGMPGSPVYAPAPVYVPPPAYPQPMVYGQPTVYVRPPAPPPRPYAFRPQLGIGFRVTGAWNANAYTDVGQGGLAGDLLFRVHPRLTLELSAGWLSTTSSSEYENAYSRTDVPFTLGARIHIGNPQWLASPYVLLAAGGGWARAYTPVVDEFGALYEASDAGWFLDGQAGGGLELRLGHHVAINMDLRLATRLRIDRQPRFEVQDYFGGSVPILGHQFGGQANFGLSFFF